MRAMVLDVVGQRLTLVDRPIPQPTDTHVLIKIHTCAVCRTDLHIVDGELESKGLPRIPGHQIIGVVQESHSRWAKGARVGVSWLAHTCGYCPFCLSGRENLCDFCENTGWHVDGGYAEYCLAHTDFLFSIPEHYTDLQAAPLMCAGTIGLRALHLAGPCRSLGFFGFGASAHLLMQIAKKRGVATYVFARPGDQKAPRLASSLGATWIGNSEQLPPEPLDAAIVFASVGSLVPQALLSVKKGGVVVCAGIQMSQIPAFPYRILWEERVLRSVANLTRRDVQLLFTDAAHADVVGHVIPYPLEQANEALDDLRQGRFSGAAVLTIAS